jgi:hypothetical protein
VEVGQGGTVVAVRDTALRDASPVLEFSSDTWAAFTGADLETAIPDLTDIPLDELGGSALAQSIALYRERLRESGVPLSSFQARI